MWQIADYRGERGSYGSVPDARWRVISETIAERGSRGFKEMKWEKVYLKNAPAWHCEKVFNDAIIADFT